MFEDKSTLIKQCNSPMNIAALALKELQARLGGTRIIADPNSPFCHLLEFGSSISAYVVQAIEEKFPLLYAHRAQTMEDLFLHMSDYDYLRLYGSPASTTLRLILPKKYLIENALNFNENYKQVTIPKDTVFMIGKYPFGMYYPINILINNYTRTFTVVYDTTKSNPLFTLTKNIVNKYDSVYNSLEFLVIDFPIYQFSKSTIEETVDGSIGFIKKYTFNNNFYAVRIFSYKNGEYLELGQSLSKLVYDTARPTALVQVMQDEHKLKITIPQIYFDEELIGSKIIVEVYTTLGPLDIDTTNISGASIRANFGLRSRDTTEFSSILKNLPFDTAMTLNGNKISGGSNAIDIETLRKRIVYDNLVQTVPITEKDIEVYLNDSGFYVKKYIDNVTDRIYYAYRTLRDREGSIIPSMTLQMRMLEQYATDPVYTGFLRQNDGSIVALPTNLYQYIEETNDVVPLTIEELQTLHDMNKQELADTLNTAQYMRTPFHVRFSLGNDYPHARSYNLMNPTVDKIIFVAENYDISSKMMTYAALVTHLNEGMGGYDVDLSVSKSDDLENIAESDILIYAVVKTTEGYWIGRPVDFIQKRDTWYQYRFHIDTNYHLTERNEIGVTNFQNEVYVLAEHSVPLTSDFYLIYMVKKSALEGVNYGEASQNVSAGVPQKYLNDYVALTRQYVTISLGHPLDDIIKNNIEIAAGGKQYAVWDHNVPAVYPNDIYQRDENGSLQYTVNEQGELELIKLHSAGEQMLDEAGQPIMAHKVGDVRYSANGEPIVAKDNIKIFYTDLMFIDAKVFASERTAEMTFASELPAILEQYFNAVRNVQQQLLERTKLYFRCVRTAGTANFNMGNGIISKQNIEMTFRIRCYVQSYVKNDLTVQNIITDAICSAIEENIQTKEISMMQIFSQVKEKLSDYIEHFTLLGINDDLTVQTFIIQDEDAQPSLRRRLVLTDDNILSLEKSLDIEFIALEDNIDEKVAYDTDD